MAWMKPVLRCWMLPFFSKLLPCVIGVEACGTAHYQARTLAAMGHEVRLIPPSYVKAYVKRGKSDALDAEAICEAVQRPTMRFVPIKTVEQQAILMTHRARSLLVRQRTMLANALRAHLAELGFEANPGIAHLANLVEQTLADKDALPSYARSALEKLICQIMTVSGEIATLDQQLSKWHIQSEASRKLAAIPGSASFRQAVRSMAWAYPATALHWRQNPARWHIEARRSISASIARCRRHCRDASRQGQVHANGKLDQETQREETIQGGVCRARQQTGPDRLGRADKEGSLSALRAFGLIN
jgi:hypothetical protein